MSGILTTLRGMGAVIGPDTMSATLDLYAPAHRGRGGAVLRNLRYGPHERHACNVFAPAGPPAGESGAVLQASRPVLVFVHGGGFVRGDKELAGSPFYDNVGHWAARQGFVGVTMNYRLAPGFQFPAAGDDVCALVRWLQREVRTHGGDAGKLFLVGHSAGATHVATCLARLGREGSVRAAVRGAVLCSGSYDLESLARDGQVPAVYFREDPVLYAAMSPAQELAGLDLPVLYAVNELEPRRFHQQGQEAALRAMHGGAAGVFRHLFLPGHNHFSSIFNLGLPAHDVLGPGIAAFVEATLAAPAPAG
ncbi:MAG: alpha/beta hydrolase [Lautropia sp.]